MGEAATEHLCQPRLQENLIGTLYHHPLGPQYDVVYPLACSYGLVWGELDSGKNFLRA